MLSKFVRMTPESVATWEETRGRGKWLYVWQVGVLKFGLLMFLVMTPLLHIQNYGLTWPPMNGLFLILMLGNLVIFAAGGLCFGLAMWSIIESAYRRHREETVGKFNDGG